MNVVKAGFSFQGNQALYWAMWNFECGLCKSHETVMLKEVDTILCTFAWYIYKNQILVINVS